MLHLIHMRHLSHMLHLSHKLPLSVGLEEGTLSAGGTLWVCRRETRSIVSASCLLFLLYFLTFSFFLEKNNGEKEGRGKRRSCVNKEWNEIWK